MREQDKQEVWEELKMQYQYDELIQTNPDVIEFATRERLEGKAQGLTEGKAQGLTEGKLDTLKSTIVDLTQARFPHLLELAQRYTASTNTITELYRVSRQLMAINDEAEARQLLTHIPS